MNKERLEQLREQAQSTADEVTRALHDNPNTGRAAAVAVENHANDQRLGQLLADSAYNDEKLRAAFDANSSYALDFLDVLGFEVSAFGAVMRKYHNTMKVYDDDGKPF